MGFLNFSQRSAPCWVSLTRKCFLLMKVNWRLTWYMQYSSLYFLGGSVLLEPSWPSCREDRVITWVRTKTYFTLPIYFLVCIRATRHRYYKYKLFYLFKSILHNLESSIIFVVDIWLKGRPWCWGNLMVRKMYINRYKSLKTCTFDIELVFYVYIYTLLL